MVQFPCLLLSRKVFGGASLLTVPLLDGVKGSEQETIFLGPLC